MKCPPENGIVKIIYSFEITEGVMITCHTLYTNFVNRPKYSWLETWGNLFYLEYGNLTAGVNEPPCRVRSSGLVLNFIPM